MKIIVSYDKALGAILVGIFSVNGGPYVIVVVHLILK